LSTPSNQSRYAGWAKLKLFLALSRTPHGVIDMTTPAFAALLWLGHIPSWAVVGLGLLTTFAGYTAVYALNDVVDYRADQRKIQDAGLSEVGSDLDAVMVRHPMAQGLLSFWQGLLWAVVWAVIALIGAYLLNPVCLFIFLAGCLLEVIYCALLQLTHLRFIISGVVKTSGPIAAVYAVDPNPSLFYVLILFLCLFFWEIGGQNIPNDWTDQQEDSCILVKTIPVCFGAERASILIVSSLIMAVTLSLILFQLPPGGSQWPFLAMVFTLGVFLLLYPAIRLFKTKRRADAMRLFNKASYFPLSILIVIISKIMFSYSS
jgi:4-hydroxybenzoate polyprenyltransferase